MRLFVAIPLAPAAVSALSAEVARLRSSGGNLRWTEPASWHITLQFLGNTDPDQYGCLVSRLAGVNARALSVRFAELGCFDRAGIFFADVTPTSDLVSLARQVAGATSLCGFVSESRPFHPHITLARAKGSHRGQSLRDLQQKIRRQPAFPSFTASEFLLYESHLASTGSTYEIRHHFPLEPLR